MAARDEAQRLAALQEVALAINASLDVNQVLDMILARACDLMAARKGSIMLLDGDDPTLHIAVAYGLSEAVIAATRVPLGEGIAGAVAESGEPRRLAGGSREREGRMVEVPAALSVPLQVGRRVIGVLNLSDRVDGREFTDADLALAMSLSAQGAVAIQNAQAYEEQERRTAEFRALQEVSLAVNESLDVNATLGHVLEKATSLLHTSSGSIMLLDESGEALTIAAAHGLAPEVVANTRVPLGQGIAGEVAQTGEARNLGAGVKAAGSRKSPSSELKAALCVPLALSGKVIGVLNVSGRDTGGDFTESDLEFLQSLGTQAAMAISNARLYEDVRARAAALGALNQIGQALTGSLDRDEVLQRVLDNALELLHCARGSLMLLTREDENRDGVLTGVELEPSLRIVVARGLPEIVVASTRIAVGEGIAGRVAATGDPAILGQGEVDANSASHERSASLCLPLKAKQRVIGVLNLAEHVGGDFTDEQVELAITLAAQAATAIENAQLYDDLRETFVHSIRAIANAIDARDPYTRGHSDRVARYSRMIAAEMELDEEELETIYYAGLLHDVGKIGIRDSILLKEGHLTDDEFDVMKSHPVKSAEIIAPVKQLRGLLPGLRYHHERFSARGYPDGLHEEEIPLMARVIGVADTYDAMTSDRPYRKALPRRVALEELAKNRGLQFDPRCVNAFLKVVERGDTVELDTQETDPANDVREALAAVEPSSN